MRYPKLAPRSLAGGGRLPPNIACGYELLDMLMAGLTVREIALRRGYTVGTVRRMLQAARRWQEAR